jgi:hypothetical protein
MHSMVQVPVVQMHLNTLITTLYLESSTERNINQKYGRESSFRGYSLPSEVFPCSTFWKADPDLAIHTASSLMSPTKGDPLFSHMLMEKTCSFENAVHDGWDLWEFILSKIKETLNVTHHSQTEVQS